MFFGRDKQTMPEPDQALPGRAEAVTVQPAHLVLGTPLDGPVPEGHEVAVFGLGAVGFAVIQAAKAVQSENDAKEYMKDIGLLPLVTALLERFSKTSLNLKIDSMKGLNQLIKFDNDIANEADLFELQKLKVQIEEVNKELNEVLEKFRSNNPKKEIDVSNSIREYSDLRLRNYGSLRKIKKKNGRAFKKNHKKFQIQNDRWRCKI